MKGNVLEDQRVAVLGHERLLAGGGAVEVAFGDGTISKRRGWVNVVAETVLLDKALRDDPEDLRPDFTDGVDTEVSVEGLVGRRVNSLVLSKNE
jgi:hypothetical protein